MGKRALPVLLLLAASSGHALDAARLMPDLTWEKRVLLVFVPDEQNAGYQRQQAILQAINEDLNERDMTVIRAFADDRVAIDEQIHAQSGASFYQRFAVNSDEFRVILVGKDGTVKLDRDGAVSAEDLFALIDSMPMRRYEMMQDE
jgi:sugar diacid utilization regulator